MPSRGLTLVSRKIAALCLLAGLFPKLPLRPDSVELLNLGDCPTRDLDLPEPLLASFWQELSTDQLYDGLVLPKLRRWASNWARLALRLLGPSPSLRLDLGWRQFHIASRLFDSTLGFPGEGPFGFWFFLLLTLFSKFRVFGAVAASSG